MDHTCTPRRLTLDEEGYAHGPSVIIPMDNGGRYEIKGMTTPHGTGRHTTISSYLGASQAVSTISLSSATSCYVHWLDKADPDAMSKMWHYDGIDSDEIIWQFLMTLSLGSAANLIKKTASEARNCEPVKAPPV